MNISKHLQTSSNISKHPQTSKLFANDVNMKRDTIFGWRTRGGRQGNKNSLLVSSLIIAHLLTLICYSHGSDRGKIDGKMMQDDCGQLAGGKSSARLCRFDDVTSKPNLKGRNEDSGVMAEKEGYVVMVFSTDGNLSDLKRTVEDLRKMAPTCPIVISVPQIHQDYRKLTSFNNIHFTDKQSDSLISPFSSYAQKTFSLLSNFPGRKYFGWAKKAVCYVPNHAKKTVSLLETSQNHSEIVEYKFSAKDAETQHEVPFGDSRYNPNFQKILLSKEGEQRVWDNSAPKEANEYISWDSKTLSNHGRCKQIERLKDSFSNLQDKFPFFKYVLIVNPRKHFSSSLIRFFLKTSEIYDMDPSLYSISAHNPLEIRGSSPHEGEILRMDSFVYGGAALIPKRIVKEIVTQFRVPLRPREKDLPYLTNHDPMNDLSEWMSWIGHRKLRGSIFPLKSRVCNQPQNCRVTMTMDFDMKSLVKHVYFSNKFESLKLMTPLLYDHLPCRNNTKPAWQTSLKDPKHAFVMYVKMISLDDDLSIRLIFKCFGLSLDNPLTGFEALHEVNWGEHVVYVIGVPYSRFSSAIVNGSELYMAETPSMDVEYKLTTIHRWEWLKNEVFNITTVPYSLVKDGNEVEKKDG